MSIKNMTLTRLGVGVHTCAKEWNFSQVAVVPVRPRITAVSDAEYKTNLFQSHTKWNVRFGGNITARDVVSQTRISLSS